MFEEEARKRMEATQIKDGSPPAMVNLPQPSGGTARDEAGALLGIAAAPARTAVARCSCRAVASQRPYRDT